MISRREVLQIGAATAALGIGSIGRAAAQQRITQDSLLSFDHYGNVTLLHIADLHAQLMPIYLREPAVNIGAGDSGYKTRWGAQPSFKLIDWFAFRPGAGGRLLELANQLR